MRVPDVVVHAPCARLAPAVPHGVGVLDGGLALQADDACAGPAQPQHVLVAAALVGGLGFRWLFAVSMVPAIGAPLAIALLVRQPPAVASGLRAGVGTMRVLAGARGPFRSLVAGVGLYGVGCIYSDRAVHLPILPRVPGGSDGPFGMSDALAPGLPGKRKT